MADKADQALKLAQKVEKDLKALYDLVRKIEKTQNDWEKEQTEWIKKIESAQNDWEKEQTDWIKSIEAKVTESHNQQAKEMQAIIDWAKKTFDTKGFF